MKIYDVSKTINCTHTKHFITDKKLMESANSGNKWFETAKLLNPEEAALVILKYGIFKNHYIEELENSNSIIE